MDEGTVILLHIQVPDHYLLETTQSQGQGDCQLPISTLLLGVELPADIDKAQQSLNVAIQEFPQGDNSQGLILRLDCSVDRRQTLYN